MKQNKVFINALLAGMMIAIGGTVFLSVDDKLIGALLFAVGLFAICTLDLNLFTGKVCYVLENDGNYLLNLVYIWLGNLLGSYFVSLIEHFTRIYPTIHKKALSLVAVKLNDSLLSIFILSFLCNLLIYLAVEEYKNNIHETGKYLGLIFGVVIFIICGFEHCVANMYYFSIADAWSIKTLVYVLVMTLGNACGGIFIPLLRRNNQQAYTLNRIIYTFLQLTWGIIQNALGLFILLVITLINPYRKHAYYHGAIVTYWKMKFSCGCGMFIFYGHEDTKDAKEVMVHEYGHTLQSMVLGPLFMLVIAIPSLIWAFMPCFVKLRKDKLIAYVSFYPEKWANHWGEKVTKERAPSR